MAITSFAAAADASDDFTAAAAGSQGDCDMELLGGTLGAGGRRTWRPRKTSMQSGVRNQTRSCRLSQVRYQTGTVEILQAYSTDDHVQNAKTMENQTEVCDVSVVQVPQLLSQATQSGASLHFP